MDNYYKGKNVEEEMERIAIPIKNLPADFLWMQVKGGSKMSNLLAHASGLLEDKAISAVVWSGTGAAISKAISCAEILKKQFSIQYQVTTIGYKKLEEYWEPKIEGLETIIVKRQIPVIHILLSVDIIPDDTQLGYQLLNGKKFWEGEPSKSTVNKQQNYKSKKPYKHKSKVP